MKWLNNHLTDFPRAPDGGAGGAAAGAGGGAAGDGAGAGAGSGAGAGKPWYDGKADAELIGHWDNKGWKKDDPVAIAIEASKAARELQKHFGVPETQLLKLPKDATDEAGWKGVFTRLGVPGEPKDYDLTGVKFNGGDLDPAFADKMRTALHQAGVIKDKAPIVVKAAIEYLESADKAEATERAATAKTERDALMKDWGANFEFNRLTAMQGAKRAVGTDDGAKKVVEAMEQAIGYKATMEFWRKIGKGTTEDTFQEGGQGGSPTTMNGAKARLAELQADPAWAAKVISKTDGAAEKREFANLMAIINAEAA